MSDDQNQQQVNTDTAGATPPKEIQDAIAAAKESLTNATEAKNNDYIKMNETSIAEWSKMKK